MRSDWPRGVFAWEYVNMVVASRCFAFRALITQARIWKSFRVQNSTSLLYLPIPPSAETWKIVQRRCVNLFWIASFCKTRTDYVCTRLRLVRISLLISAITEFCVFFSGKLFYKSNRKLFSCVCIACSSRVCITVNCWLSTPRVFISGYANTEKVFYCLNSVILGRLLLEGSRNLKN